MSELRECVLVVDDDAMIADLWSLLLEDMGLDVCGHAATASVAIAIAKRHRPKLVLMDVRLKGGLDGVDAAAAIRASVGSKVIFITGSQDSATLARIHLDHPTSVLFKPVSNVGFQTAVRAAMH